MTVVEDKSVAGTINKSNNLQENVIQLSNEMIGLCIDFATHQESHDHIGDGLRAVGWLTGDARLYFNFSSDYCDDAGPLNVVQGHPSLLFLLADKELLIRYNKIIQKQLQSNIIEEVSTDMNHIGIIHYLPHHEVLTPSKLTTKLTIVYDASEYLKGMKSLNDVLYRGPITLPDLIGVLLRFRIMKNMIVADIEKAFL
ncbi:Pao retrotransposon peptidase family protein [Dirofilaria immitis]|nr:Pao retrotransposon peptidase family protein [Dirofilaria immitis]